MKEKDLKNALLELGRKKGVISFDELNDTFPADYCPLDETERFLERLELLGVRVVEDRKHVKVRARHRRAA
ncbi:MAG: RNA polymerase sigma factor region1.1 domain-containing protein [Candidatus Sulfobium sp.]|jgi:hypothetical protein